MKYKVIKPFRDKVSGDVFNEKGIYETDSQDRVKELNGYLGEEIGADPEDNLSYVLDGNVNEVNAAIKEFEKDDLEKLLSLEKEDKNRKSVISSIEELLQEQSE